MNHLAPAETGLVLFAGLCIAIVLFVVFVWAWAEFSSCDCDGGSK